MKSTIESAFGRIAPYIGKTACRLSPFRIGIGAGKGLLVDGLERVRATLHSLFGV